MATTQDEMIAELQRANVELRQERDAALAQKVALSEVLDIIKRSPGDPGLVFDAILEKAHRLCGADVGTLTIYDGEYLRNLASRGLPEELAEILRQPFEPTVRHQVLVRGERLNYIQDVQAVVSKGGDEAGRRFIEQTGVRTFLQVPLRRDGTFLGFIGAHRLEVRSYTESEIALLESFAAQAVIAIENARLITEQREALEQQTATAEVLQVINASPGNLAPVFETILEKAHSLCNVAVGSLSIYVNGLVHTAATRGFSQEYRALLRRPYPAIGSSHQALMRGGPSRQTPDFRTAPVSPEMASSFHHIERMNLRTGLWVPLRKDGTALGCISLYRDKVQPFSDKEIALLENFAAQAVIAMENARLLEELRQRTDDLQESLEYQTATSDVLKVISRSTFDLQPVLDALVQTAARLCEADTAGISTRDGDVYRVVAVWSGTPAFGAFIRDRSFAPNRRSVTGRTVLDGEVVHVADLTADPEYAVTEAVTLGRVRTLLGVPLLREGQVVGVINLGRMRVQPFSDRQIELVNTFANQAVIAIENTRLLTEQQEALEQQTATAEVLQVINASPGNLAPVFDAILEKAHSLCGAARGALVTFDGEHFRAVATRGLSEAYVKLLREPQNNPPGSPPAELLGGANLVHVADFAALALPIPQAAVKLEGARTVLFILCGGTATCLVTSPPIARRCVHLPASRSFSCKTSQPRR